MLQWTLINQYGCFKLWHFSKKSDCLSSVGPEILAFSSNCSTKFQPTFDCFIPNSELKHEDSENTTTDCTNAFISTYIKSNRGRFFGTPVSVSERMKKKWQTA